MGPAVGRVGEDEEGADAEAGRSDGPGPGVPKGERPDVVVGGEPARRAEVLRIAALVAQVLLVKEHEGGRDADAHSLRADGDADPADGASRRVGPVVGRLLPGVTRPGRRALRGARRWSAAGVAAARNGGPRGEERTCGGGPPH